MQPLFYSSIVIFALYITYSATGNVPQCQIGATDPNFNCSAVVSPDEDCSKPTSCLYPNPNNCSRFYQCSNGAAYCLECAGSSPDRPLYFSPKTNQCEYRPHDYQCYPTEIEPVDPPQDDPPASTTDSDDTTTEEDTTTPEPTETTTGEPDTTTEEEDDTTTPEPAETTTGEPDTTTPEEDDTTTEESDTTTPEPEDDPPVPTPPPATNTTPVCESPRAQYEINRGCPEPRYCMFTNPYSCRSFIQCQDNGLNPPIEKVMPCANQNVNGNLVPQYWDDSALRCGVSSSTCQNPSRGLNIASILFKV